MRCPHVWRGVRTLAYVANRPDWLADADHWRGVTRVLEERLSDTLHEKLMARFIDRRTSALMRGLARRDELLAGVAADGVVTVEGHYVGRLRGLRFDAARGAGALEAKALRAAAQRAVAPEMARRLGQLAAEPDEAFTLEASGDVLWRGEAAGTLVNDQPFSPAVRLYGDLGPQPVRERAARRLEAFVAVEANRRLGALKCLTDAVASGAIKGLARGLVYRLIEAGGVLDRRDLETDLGHLSQAERRALRGLGVRIGTFSLFLPSQITPDAQAVAQAFAGTGRAGLAPSRTHAFSTAFAARSSARPRVTRIDGGWVAGGERGLARTDGRTPARAARPQRKRPGNRLSIVRGRPRGAGLE